MCQAGEEQGMGAEEPEGTFVASGAQLAAMLAVTAPQGADGGAGRQDPDIQAQVWQLGLRLSMQTFAAV